jgi:hypothetical protein
MAGLNIVVVDGQGGRLGGLLIEKIKAALPGCGITAIGTNATATAAMIRAGADGGATGENPAVVAARRADVIVGPIGMVIADSLLGEVTAAMAAAIGQSGAKRILIPINRCDNMVAGVADLSVTGLVDEAVAMISEISARGG